MQKSLQLPLFLDLCQLLWRWQFSGICTIKLTHNSEPRSSPSESKGANDSLGNFYKISTMTCQLRWKHAYECFVNLHCVIKKDINRAKQNMPQWHGGILTFFKRKQGPVGFQTKEALATSNGFSRSHEPIVFHWGAGFLVQPLGDGVGILVASWNCLKLESFLENSSSLKDQDGTRSLFLT